MSFEVEKQLQQYLFQLYHNDQEIRCLDEELESKQNEVDSVTMEKERVEDDVKERMREQKRVAKELHKLEQNIHELVRTELLTVQVGGRESHSTCLSRRIQSGFFC